MKICPQCQNTYTDDSLQFCLQDGKQLNFAVSSSQQPTLSWTDEPETLLRGERNQMRISLPEQQTSQPQTYTTTPQVEAQIEPPKKSRIGLFIALGLLAFLAIGGIGAVGVWYYLNSSGSNVVIQNPNTNINIFTENTNQNTNSNANATPTATATPTPKPTLKPAEIEASKKEVESTLYGWKSAAENHNLDANISNYADTVDYYKGGKISKSKLKSSKDPAYKKYDSIDIELSNMKVTTDPNGEKATVTFDKTWDFAGVDKDGNDVINRGSVQQQIVLNKINGKWKIVSEKDVKVYYVDKGEEDDY